MIIFNFAVFFLQSSIERDCKMKQQKKRRIQNLIIVIILPVEMYSLN